MQRQKKSLTFFVRLNYFVEKGVREKMSRDWKRPNAGTKHSPTSLKELFTKEDEFQRTAGVC
jgi:hypothetical protein